MYACVCIKRIRRLRSHTVSEVYGQFDLCRVFAQSYILSYDHVQHTCMCVRVYSSLITPHTCARGKMTGCVRLSVVCLSSVSTKIARSED